ncbi:MAG TPA: PilZ domain-containing protein, partial [Nitrospirota bacterium]
RAEKVDLIVALLDMPGMKSEQLYTAIREDGELRAVSLIILCPDDPVARERSAACKANMVLTLPLDVPQFVKHAQQFLDISLRGSYRVLLSVSVEGSARHKPFFCRSENISTTGLLLETDRDLQEGDRLTCSFFLPGSKQIIAAGEVVRRIERSGKSGARRYGVKFGRLKPDVKTAIEDFVAKKTQSSASQPA